MLVCATLGAFLVTQRLKHSPNAVQGFRQTPSFSPGARLGRSQERLSFRIARADEVTVTVLDAAGRAVAIPVAAAHLRAYHRLSLSWDGRTMAGALAPAGVYRMRVTLRRQRRTVLAPRSFRLLPAPPPSVAGPTHPPASGG